MKHLNAIGQYFLMIKEVFHKPTKWSITKNLIFKEIDDLIYGALGIVIFISFFVGGVVAIQTALNIDNPLIPKYLVGFATRSNPLFWSLLIHSLPLLWQVKLDPTLHQV